MPDRLILSTWMRVPMFDIASIIDSVINSIFPLLIQALITLLFGGTAIF